MLCALDSWIVCAGDDDASSKLGWAFDELAQEAEAAGNDPGGEDYEEPQLGQEAPCCIVACLPACLPCEHVVVQRCVCVAS